MSELQRSLDDMNFVQYLLAFAFLMSYVLGLGGALGSRGRRRAWALALASAISFAAVTKPWVNGVLLVAFAVGGLALFIGAVWFLNLMFAMFRRDAVASIEETPELPEANETWSAEAALPPERALGNRLMTEHGAIDQAGT